MNYFSVKIKKDFSVKLQQGNSKNCVPPLGMYPVL